MFCKHCGKAIIDGADFCKFCGKPQKLLCPKCGKEQEDGAVFCKYCGERLDKRGGWQPHQPAAPSQPPTIPTAAYRPIPSAPMPTGGGSKPNNTKGKIAVALAGVALIGSIAYGGGKIGGMTGDGVKPEESPEMSAGAESSGTVSGHTKADSFLDGLFDGGGETGTVAYGNIDTGERIASDGTWLYLLQRNEYNLIKMKPDGSDATEFMLEVYNGEATEVNCIDGAVYLTVDGEMSKYTEETGALETVTVDENQLSGTVRDGQYYYWIEGEDGLWRDTENGPERVSSNVQPYSWAVCGNYIYYINTYTLDDTDGIYREEIGSGAPQRLYSWESELGETVEYDFAVNENGMYICFPFLGADVTLPEGLTTGVIYRIDSSGAITKLEDVADEYIHSIDVYGDTLYYTVGHDVGPITLYRIRDDGSEKEALMTLSGAPGAIRVGPDGWVAIEGGTSETSFYNFERGVYCYSQRAGVIFGDISKEGLE